MQISLWDPLTFLSVCLAFFVFFITLMYTKRMMWFQHTDEPRTDNWFTRYRAKDEATGNWGRRFVVPAAALYLLLAILYPDVMNVLVLSSFQRLAFLMIYLSYIFIIFIFFGVRHARISRHVLETRPEDPLPYASKESDDLG